MCRNIDGAVKSKIEEKNRKRKEIPCDRYKPHHAWVPAKRMVCVHQYNNCLFFFFFLKHDKLSLTQDTILYDSITLLCDVESGFWHIDIRDIANHY